MTKIVFDSKSNLHVLVIDMVFILLIVDVYCSILPFAAFDKLLEHILRGHLIL